MKHSKLKERSKFKSTCMYNIMHLQNNMIKEKIQSEGETTGDKPRNMDAWTANFSVLITIARRQWNKVFKGSKNCSIVKIIVPKIVYAAKLSFKNKDKIFKQINWVA